MAGCELWGVKISVSDHPLKAYPAGIPLVGAVNVIAAFSSISSVANISPFTLHLTVYWESAHALPPTMRVHSRRRVFKRVAFLTILLLLLLFLPLGCFSFHWAFKLFIRTVWLPSLARTYMKYVHTKAWNRQFHSRGFIAQEAFFTSLRRCSRPAPTVQR